MKKKEVSKQPWISSAPADILFILSPPFFALLAVILFPDEFRLSSQMPLIYWVVLIVFIDVAHVYGTLYRTYFNPDNLKEQFSLFISIPILCYVAGVILHSIHPPLFWSAVAYLAVFHFIRQQYGFMSIYSRKDDKNVYFRTIDKIAIYSATIYPILYWHLCGSRNFNWLIDGDFLYFQSGIILTISSILYFMIIALYTYKRNYLFMADKAP